MTEAFFRTILMAKIDAAQKTQAPEIIGVDRDFDVFLIGFCKKRTFQSAQPCQMRGRGRGFFLICALSGLRLERKFVFKQIIR